MGRAIRAAVVIALIAMGTRLATANEVLAALLTGSAAVLAVGIGMATNSRRNQRTWRRAWFLLWLAIAARASGTVLEVLATDMSDDFPSRVHALQGIGAVLALVGVDRLMRHRHPGRASEVLFESAIMSTLLGLALWLVVVEPRSGAAVPEWELLFALVVAGTGVATLWVLVRLMLLTDEHPVAYRYLAVGFLCLITVDAVIAGGLLEGGGFGDRYRSALVLWGYVLWGVAALHPSMRSSFDPVPHGSTELRATRVAFVIGAAAVGPALVVLQTVRGVEISVPSELLASMVVPLLVTVEMVRQVRERATREYLAQHDGLTGLPNRILFYDRLQMALAHARRTDRRVGVMFLDLDRFKEVNDSLGHDVGNQLLQGVARRLRRCLREQDAIARFGGDEFTVLLTDLDSSDACAAVAEKVLRAFREPFTVTGRQLFAATSIGVAVFPGDGADADTLMKNADTAMYRAKAKGRSGYEFYTREMSTRAEVRHSLEGSLHRAIERGELALHYQPKVHRADRTLTGVEALVRWHHPRLGSIPPSAFVPLAEESGLILPLGEWVLREACQQAATWSLSRSAPIAVAVNVSARQFMHEPLEVTVARVLEETGLDPTLLELELTESVFLRDIDAVNVTMQRLHEMGVRCSIDDFGTGFSALNYLGRMPIDTVKIDGSFVSDIRADRPAPLLVAMISMAKSLDLGVVAEGVETEEQAEFLLRHGCEQMQGYLFSRPLPPSELEQLLMLWDAASAHATALMPAGAVVSAAGIAGLDPKTVIGLLEAACGDGDPLHADPELVRAVLAALEDPQLAVAQWAARSLPVRLAAGTFAGLVPLSGGLLAADMLPAGAHHYASMAFSNLGVEMPHLEHEGPRVFSTAEHAPEELATSTTVLGSTARRSTPLEVEAPPRPRADDPVPRDDLRTERDVGRPDRGTPPRKVVDVPPADDVPAPTVRPRPPERPDPRPTPTPPPAPPAAPPQPDRAPPRPDKAPEQPKPDEAPDGAKPDGAKPDGAKPDGTKPDGTEPDGTKPDETPGQGAPNDRSPAPEEAPVEGEKPPARGTPPVQDHTPPAPRDGAPARDHTPAGPVDQDPVQDQDPTEDQGPPPPGGNDPVPERPTPPDPDPQPPAGPPGPPARDHAPPGLEEGGPDQDQSPPGLEEGGPDQDQSPPGLEEGGPGQDQSPPGLEEGGPGQDQSPPGLEEGGPGQDQSPPGLEEGGPGQDAPNERQTPPDPPETGPEQDRAAPEQDTPPNRQGVDTPEEGQTPPAQDATRGADAPGAAGRDRASSVTDGRAQA